MRLILLSGILLVAAPKRPDVPAPPSIWKPLPPPRRGEWRDLYREEGQTFAEFREARPVRETGRDAPIYVQPWLTRPPDDRRLFERIASLLRSSFGREVKILPPASMPARAYDRKRRQYTVVGLAARLVRTLPDDALFMLAVTDRDLRLESFDFAFGWGSLEHRVAVMSTRRLGRGPAVLRRTLGLALHESGHALSLPHCVFFPCLMNGARSLAEADRRPMQLCPVCRSKLCWKLDLEPGNRYAALEKALSAAGLAEDARATHAAADATRKHPG